MRSIFLKVNNPTRSWKLINCERQGHANRKQFREMLEKKEPNGNPLLCFLYYKRLQIN